jgi:hypothetical protein
MASDSCLSPAPEGAIGLLVERLRGRLRHGGTMQAGQVQFVNLADICELAGAHWPAVRARIQEGSTRIARECLEPEDIIIPCADGFLVFFADSSNADERAQALAEGLTVYYAGEEGLETLRARGRALTVSERDLHLLAPTEPHAPSQGGTHALALVPVWSGAAHAIICQAVIPTHCADGVVCYGYDPQYRKTGEHAAEDYSAIDEAVLEAALAHLRALQAMGQAQVVGLAVHSSTMRRQKARTAYLNALREIDESLRRRLFIKIAEIDIGTPLSELVYWTGALKHCVSHVGLEFHFGDRVLGRLRETGAWSMGCQLPPHPVELGAAALAKLALDVQRWAAAAAGARMRLFLDNFRCKALLQRAEEAGVHFATSAIWWPPTPIKPTPAPAIS